MLPVRLLPLPCTGVSPAADFLSGKTISFPQKNFFLPLGKFSLPQKNFSAKHIGHCGREPPGASAEKKNGVLFVLLSACIIFNFPF